MVVETSDRGAGAPGAASGTLALNFFPASWSSDTVRVFAGPYIDVDAFDALRRDAVDCTVWRDALDSERVFVVPHRDDVTFRRDGFRAALVRVEENPYLFAHLLKDGIGRHLEGLGFTRVRRREFGFANWNVGNLLDRVKAPGFAHVDPRVGVYPRIIVESFITGEPDAAPSIGVVVDIAYDTRLDVPVDQLIASRFDVVGRYVKLARDHEAPHAGLLIGRVRAIEGQDLLLDDARDATYVRIAATACVLDPSRPNLLAYLGYLAGPAAAAVNTRLREIEVASNTPREKLRLTEAFARYRLTVVDGAPLAIGGGLSVTFGAMTAPSSGASMFMTRELPAPAFSFDPVSPKTHGVADDGLRLFGPYGQERLRAKRVRVLLLAPETYKGQAQAFLQVFRQGVSDGRLYRGFAQKFRLAGVDVVERYFAVGNPKETYANAARDAIEDSTAYDLAIVMIRESFKALPPADNPYFVVKALLLSFGIGVQEVRIETAQQPESTLRWAINQMALACYAKIGGTPFVLRTTPTRTHELVFGIGRSIDRPSGSRLASMSQVIGFTTVFRSDGDYLLNSCTPYTDMANYERELERVVERAVAEAVASESIPDGATIRLIFHVFKSTGRREVAAIENVIAKLTRYTVEYALLHVNDSHAFRLYDRGSSELIPPRRTSVAIGPRERLVVLIGPKQYLRRGNPAPLRITLDKRSTFQDMDYLVEQLCHFSAVSWRSFNTTTQPVTVFYAELMAQLNRELRLIAAYWNADTVRLKLARKLWFL